MAVSGEFKYLGPAFSSVERVRPVNAIMRPLSFVIGNMIRLRNLEYMAERPASGFGLRAPEKPAPGFSLWASDSGPTPGPSTSVDRSLARDPLSLGMTELGGGMTELG